MVELTPEAIKVINKITKAVNNTKFEVSRFEVMDNGLHQITIELRVDEKKAETE